MIVIRREREGDETAVFAVNSAAFQRAAEAELVDKLRAAKQVVSAWVAIWDEEIVGHLLFSPVTVTADNGRSATAVALGPVAVLPKVQRQGIGDQLIRTGLAALTEAGHALVVLLGYPGYYPRFGFVPASRFGLRSEFELPAALFMALPLTEAGAECGPGLVKYRPEFKGV